MPRLTASLLVLSLALFTTGCDVLDHGSPTASRPDRYLVTRWGDAAVVTNGHPWDEAAALAAVERGYVRAIEQVPRLAAISLDGATISVEEMANYGAYSVKSDTIRQRIGVEAVIDHELQHRLCHLATSSDNKCCRCVDHAPSGDSVCERGYEMLECVR